MRILDVASPGLGEDEHVVENFIPEEAVKRRMKWEDVKDLLDPDGSLQNEQEKKDENNKKHRERVASGRVGKEKKARKPRSKLCKGHGIFSFKRGTHAAR